MAAVALAALLAVAHPAAAEAEMTIEAGYAGGQIVIGRPVPVRVQIAADTLTEGTLTVTPLMMGDPLTPIVTPVEIAGGSVKDFLVVMPTEWSGTFGPGEVEVVLRVGDDEVERTTFLRAHADIEVVGLIPGLVTQAPDPVELPADLGTAHFALLDDRALATPGALGPLSTIVTGPDGISSLPVDAQQNVLRWVEEGGQLVVDAPPGSRLDGVPDDWQPAGVRQAAGAGWIRLTDGAAARGKWAGIVEPSRQFGPHELDSGIGWSSEGVPDAIARDAGLRIPDIGWLAGFLVAYVVLVGPVTFLLLRRSRRTTLAWLAVPSIAVLFTGTAFAAGNSLRSGARASHGSIVTASPLGDQVVSHVGMVSRDGKDPTATFPAGWHASSFAFDPSMGGMFFDAPMPLAPADAVPRLSDDGRPAIKLPLEAGGFGVVTGRGRIDGPSTLEVVAEADDVTISGTVTNTSEHDLDHVMVVAAGRAIGLDHVAAGATVDWSVDIAAVDAAISEDPWSPIERPWDHVTGYSAPPDPTSVVNYPVYAAEIGRQPDSYTSGVALAVGWTTGWSPEVDVDLGFADGRTAFVARSAITPARGTIPAAAVRRDIVRGPETTPFDPPVQVPGWGDASGLVARFVLPEGSDPSTRLALNVASGVVQAEVWDGSRWVEIDLDPPVNADQFMGPEGPRRSAPLPAGVVHDGNVYIRAAAAFGGPLHNLLELGSAT